VIVAAIALAAGMTTTIQAAHEAQPPRLVLQIFAGAGLEPLRVARPVTPYEVAPTLANDLGVKPPSGSIGNPLVEVLPHS
jgi:hypothetical protein